jgi:hypothetical protein
VIPDDVPAPGPDQPVQWHVEQHDFGYPAHPRRPGPNFDAPRIIVDVLVPEPAPKPTKKAKI